MELLQCVLQCAAVCCSVLQCVAVCCSVSQCVAVCCNMLQSRGQTCSLCTPFNSNREKKATQQKLARSKNKLCAGDSRRMEGKTTSLTHIFAGGKREGEVSKKNKTCCAAGDSRWIVGNTISSNICTSADSCVNIKLSSCPSSSCFFFCVSPSFFCVSPSEKSMLSIWSS